VDSGSAKSPDLTMAGRGARSWPRLPPGLRANPPLAAALGILLVYGAFLCPLVYSVDGNSMLAVSESLALHHSFAIGPQFGVLGRAGRFYSIWYPLLSILAVPFVWVGSIAGKWTGLPLHYALQPFALILQDLITALTAYVTALLALRLGARMSGAVWAAIGFAFGTCAMVYARSFFADPLLALLTVVGIYLQLGKRRAGTFAAAAVSALAVLAKPTGVILGPILGAYAMFTRRSLWAGLPQLSGTTAGALAYLGYNKLRFDGWLTFGHAQAATVQGFTIAVLPWSTIGLLVGTGNGLLWYCPIVLALAGLSRWVWRRPDVRLVAVVGIAYLAIYSPRFDWAGGWAWGPRLLVPALPGWAALCGLLEDGWRSLFIALIAAGLVVNAPNLVSFYQRYLQECLVAASSAKVACSQPPFLRIWGSAYREINDARTTDVDALVRQAGSTDTGPQDWRTLRIVAVWWWLLPAAGIPRIAGASVALCLVLAGGFLMRGALIVTPEPADTHAQS
jgi:hypothetical protein